MGQMDEIVLRAMRRWPDVPAVYGWLNLDRRGNWSIKGERVTHPGLQQFIARNYVSDAHGRWFFQNGPQRVFVTLAYAPYVYRTRALAGALVGLTAHTGVEARTPRAAWLDEQGTVLVQSELGLGTIHDLDLGELARCVHTADSAGGEDDALEQLLTAVGSRARLGQLSLAGALLPLSPIRSVEVPSRFGYVLNPRPAAGEAEC